jgi:hypothetical protein
MRLVRLDGERGPSPHSPSPTEGPVCCRVLMLAIGGAALRYNFKQKSVRDRVEIPNTR